MVKTRRSKGDGSIIDLPNGKKRVRLEIDPVDGKRRWLSATVDTKTEAIAKLKQFERQKQDGILRQRAEEDTIPYQAALFYTHLRAQGRAGATIVNARTALVWLQAVCTGIPVSKLVSQDIDNLLLALRENNAKEATINTYLSKLVVFFGWLLANQRIAKNPMDGYSRNKRIVTKKHTLIVLSLEEHERLKAYYQKLWDMQWQKTKYKLKRSSLKYRMLPLYCLAYETGIRDGELAALTWDCLDIENHTITVKKTIASDEVGHRVLSPVPKTINGYRTIKISEKTTKLLVKLRERQGDTEYIFNSSYAGRGYSNPSSICRLFQAGLREVGITRPFTFHDIRHTNASNMIYKGVPITVIAERLGHSSVAVTYSTYAHIIQECKASYTAVIEA